MYYCNARSYKWIQVWVGSVSVGEIESVVVVNVGAKDVDDRNGSAQLKKVCDELETKQKQVRGTPAECAGSKFRTTREGGVELEGAMDSGDQDCVALRCVALTLRADEPQRDETGGAIKELPFQDSQDHTMKSLVSPVLT